MQTCKESDCFRLTKYARLLLEPLDSDQPDHGADRSYLIELGFFIRHYDSSCAVTVWGTHLMTGTQPSQWENYMVDELIDREIIAKITE